MVNHLPHKHEDPLRIHRTGKKNGREEEERGAGWRGIEKTKEGGKEGGEEEGKEGGRRGGKKGWREEGKGSI